jgi:hypothetical protein
MKYEISTTLLVVKLLPWEDPFYKMKRICFLATIDDVPREVMCRFAPKSSLSSIKLVRPTNMTVAAPAPYFTGKQRGKKKKSEARG